MPVLPYLPELHLVARIGHPVILGHFEQTAFAAIRSDMTDAELVRTCRGFFALADVANSERYDEYWQEEMAGAESDEDATGTV